MLNHNFTFVCPICMLELEVWHAQNTQQFPHRLSNDAPNLVLHYLAGTPRSHQCLSVSLSLAFHS